MKIMQQNKVVCSTTRNDISNLQVCDENANDESSLPEPIANAG